jgi:superfamily I DNA/RNA helicase
VVLIHHARGRGHGFRDADAFGLNNFGAIYGVDPTYLATSYRCPTSVLGLAEEVARRMPVVPGLTARPPLTSHESCGPGEVRVATFKSLLAEVLWVVQRVRERHQPTVNAAIDTRAAVIAPRDVEVYVDQLNKASDRLGAGLVFHDARDHETFTDQPPFRVAYATLRIAEDETDGLAWRTLLAFCDGVGAATILALYNAGAGQLTAALRASAPTNAKLKGLRDFILIAREQLRTADTREAAWTVLRGVVTSLLPGSEIESWRGRIDGAALQNEPDGAAAQLLARFRDRTHGTVADAATTQHDVLVYTIFGSKGQQWPHVFIVGAYSQGFQDSVAADGLRKLYVTLTRSMATLTITLPRFVRHTPLEQVLPTYTPTFTADLVEAFAARAIPIEVDPT